MVSGETVSESERYWNIYIQLIHQSLHLAGTPGTSHYLSTKDGTYESFQDMLGLWWDSCSSHLRHQATFTAFKDHLSWCPQLDVHEHTKSSSWAETLSRCGHSSHSKLNYSVCLSVISQTTLYSFT